MLTRSETEKLFPYALMIRGEGSKKAEDMLLNTGFSPSEAAEIVASVAPMSRRSATPIDGYKIRAGLDSIMETIKSTLDCSIRLGDRFDYNL